MGPTTWFGRGLVHSFFVSRSIAEEGGIVVLVCVCYVFTLVSFRFVARVRVCFAFFFFSQFCVVSPKQNDVHSHCYTLDYFYSSFFVTSCLLYTLVEGTIIYHHALIPIPSPPPHPPGGR